MSLLHSHTASKTHRQDPDLPAPPPPSMLFLIPRESSEQRGRPRPCVPELQLQASRGGVSGRSPEPLVKRELQIHLPLPPASESGDSGTLTLQASMVLAWSRTALALLNESLRETVLHQGASNHVRGHQRQSLQSLVPITSGFPALALLVFWAR